MIKISAELNRVLFDAIHAIVGMACDRGVYVPDCGLCLNVEEWVERNRPDFRDVDFYHLLANIFEDMGLSRSYPVRYPVRYPIRYPSTGHVGGLWSGSQFRLRMDLCSKLMSYLDIQLAQENLREQDSLLDALKALANIPNKFMPWPHQGICSNASAMLRNYPTYSTLSRIFAELGYADRDYPLGQDDGFPMKWENPRRRELLAQVIQHLEAI